MTTISLGRGRGSTAGAVLRGLTAAFLLTVSTFGMVAVAGASVPLDVNRASVAQLAELPGIGESKAAAIVAERTKAPFTSIEDLARVKGIGPATVEDLRAHVTTGAKK